MQDIPEDYGKTTTNSGSLHYITSFIYITIILK